MRFALALLLLVPGLASAQTEVRSLALPDSFAVDDVAPWPGDSGDLAILLRKSGAGAETSVPRLIRFTTDGEIVADRWLSEGRSTNHTSQRRIQGTGTAAAFFPSAYGLGVRYAVEESVSDHAYSYTYAQQLRSLGPEGLILALAGDDRVVHGPMSFGGTVLYGSTWTETWGTEKAAVGLQFWDKGADPMAARARGHSEDLPETEWRDARARLVPGGGAMVWTRGGEEIQQLVTFWLSSTGATVAPPSVLTSPVAFAELAPLLPGPDGGVLVFGTGLEVADGVVGDARISFLAAVRPNRDPTLVRLQVPDGHRVLEGLNLGQRLLFLSIGGDGIPTLTVTDTALQPTATTPLPRFAGMAIRLTQLGSNSHVLAIEAEGATSRLHLSAAL